MFEGLKNLVPQTVKNYYHLIVAGLAALFFRFPARGLKIIGVTGTDGKTTTVHMIYHLLKEAGEKVSMISTVKAVIGEKEYSTGLHVTTPNSFQIQRLLREMVDAGSEIAVVEITSHGLDQNRVAFIPIYTAVITNVTHEHIDYHGSFAAYLEAKAKILRGAKYRVLNCDDANFEVLKHSGSGLLISFGLAEKADFRGSSLTETTSGISFKASFKNKQKKKISENVLLPVLGRFNSYNALAALVTVCSLGIEADEVADKFSTFQLPQGRMQVVSEGQDFYVIVDFAHTPAALDNALKSLKEYTHHQIISVFGAAGERDRMKRAAMGKVSTELADLSIFTSEDPRNEDPGEIIEQIATGAIAAGGSLNQTFWKIASRAEAINLAVKNLARKGDIVAIFGKGHEASMNIGGQEIPWNDEEVARKALRARLIK
ncbi:MAG: hypothetical protein A3F35_02100 [Candidatus Woykebacteria bacterium RIFCSPHIGHO2_12_FULL_45_10]|uniref:UDP-N-acetylmuramyl-tripeptide synthetase n=1 Tax=Candidatus Woykebacteria bacterium RIFCSPHIGHO2_12_FULL_45_10 TaxID=1802603 RepID=A0A1G1WMF1_9BACT|nr:MAG: hypothetical protein A3F35_02100 [Candidatus Woykebacteria bacterium RIFCSPHIGHO2_12_FULL_45_10]